MGREELEMATSGGKVDIWRQRGGDYETSREVGEMQKQESGMRIYIAGVSVEHTSQTEMGRGSRSMVREK